MKRIIGVTLIVVSAALLCGLLIVEGRLDADSALVSVVLILGMFYGGMSLLMRAMDKDDSRCERRLEDGSRWYGPPTTDPPPAPPPPPDPPARFRA